MNRPLVWTGALAMLLALPAFGSAGEPSSEEARPEQRDSIAPVNLNKATEQELVRLPGIGPSRAKAIIAARERRRFRRPEEILRVHGIGRKTFKRLRPYLRVKDPPKSKASNKDET